MLGAGALQAACKGPLQAESMTLEQAHFEVAWLTGEQDDAGVVTLSVEMGSSNPNPCPVVGQTVVTVNGVPMRRSSPGGLYQDCADKEYDCDLGSPYTQKVTLCGGPSWTLVNPPVGPLSVIASDPATALQIDVGDMGTRRTLTLASLQDAPAAPRGAGSFTLRWFPALDAIDGWFPAGPVYGYEPHQFGIQDLSWQPAAGDGPRLEWAPDPLGESHVTVHGADVSAAASSALYLLNVMGIPDAPVPGVFHLSELAAFPPSRCDFPHCDAMFLAALSVSATWQPFRP